MRIKAAAIAFAIAFALAGLVGCARLGFTDRVLVRVTSPDGQLVAICQEVPEFDGPNYTVRLERPDGTVFRQLFLAGYGNRCTEIAWSQDSKRLGVLAGHVARVKFVDVALAAKTPAPEVKHWWWREITVTGPSILGKDLRFTDAMEVELQLCPYSPEVVQGTRQFQCAGTPVARRVSVPEPNLFGRRQAS